MLRACVFSVFLVLCCRARGQDACPWLTTGTAAALMGEDVKATVHVKGGEGTCEFASVVSGGRPSMESVRMTITATRVVPKECATGERLRGIGQDAVFCATDAQGEHSEAVRGRVRSIYFLLTLTGREAAMGHKTSWRHALELAAEEVAGNLF